MREFTITEEQIKKLARCGAPALMHEWFPAAFEPEWEEVPLYRLKLYWEARGILSISIQENEGGGDVPFVVIPSDWPSAQNYKIKDGKIWRRKP